MIHIGDAAWAVIQRLRRRRPALAILVEYRGRILFHHVGRRGWQ